MAERFFVVRGCGNFPLYMLYRCHCYPATENDAEKMSYAIPTQASEQFITLARADGIPLWSELWKAANWPIMSTY